MNTDQTENLRESALSASKDFAVKLRMLPATTGRADYDYNAAMLTFMPFASAALFSPPLHGSLGALDEIALFCLPVVVAILVLAVTSRRARRQERVRQRMRTSNHRDSENAENI